VFSSDDVSFSIFVWDTKTGDLVKKMPAHNDAIRFVIQ